VVVDDLLQRRTAKYPAKRRPCQHAAPAGRASGNFEPDRAYSF
jgi:hypothetical protein